MNKSVLHITAPTDNIDLEEDGYLNVLKQVGWTTLKYHPHTKAEIRDLIIDQNLSLIFTHARYGTRQLPVETINEHNVCVAVKLLPLTEDDTDVNEICKIKTSLIYSHVYPDSTNNYFDIWKNVNITHVWSAANVLQSMPETLNKSIDIAFLCRGGGQDILRWIDVIGKRLEVLGLNFEIIDTFQTSTKDIINIIGKSKFTCTLANDIQRFQLQTLSNYDFMSMLYGSLLITNNPIVNRILSNRAIMGLTLSSLLSHIEKAIDEYDKASLNILDNACFIANHHTYHNRLIDNCLDMDKILKASTRLGIKHSWAMQAKLESKEKVYGKSVELT